MKKTALYLMILTIFIKLLGFGRDMTLSYFYGASKISDAYLISITIPTIIFAFVGTGIATGYIPMYHAVEKEKGVEDADKFTSTIVNFVLMIATVVVIIVLIFAEPIVRLFASGFDGDTLNLAVGFTRFSILSVYFYGLVFIFNGYLQVKNNFIIPALIGLPLDLLVIVSIFLSTKTNIMVLAFGTVIAVAFEVVLLLPFAYHKGFRYRMKFDRKNPYLKKIIFLSIPVIIGASVNEINVLVDRTMASRIAIGGITALTYANRLNLFIKGIFITSVATVIYPMISKMAAKNNMNGLKKTVSGAVNSISLLVLPASVGAMVFARPVVSLLFGRGAFDEQAVEMTAGALFFYSIGMVAVGYREILSRAFYSFQDTKTPTINAAIGMVMNIILNLILSRIMGISGLALATSISAIVTSILLFVNLRKKIGSFGVREILFSFLKVSFAGLLMGVFAKLSFSYLTTSFGQNISLFVSIIIGALAYMIIIYFMKIEDFDLIVRAVKRKIGMTSV
ncbi:MAG: murein biosynthesis integral membrane protein MurJ [Clostridiaceae bacterium]